ncbi:MAG TPA: nucleotidyl transferase AbiEii/AbiGii toxin family protein [Planctomycetaceae bacterium]|nr:nucleotidyl transferase AbiEii/AbiGii toxin family protein [Planctomycetaceae bacterium]
MVTGPETGASGAAHPGILTYEGRLANDLRWAMTEGSLFFEGKGAVQESLRRIANRLNELGIPYALVGGMALFEHGYRRFTEDVDILVTRDALKAIHAALDGRGYVRPFERSKNLRDAESRVKIEFLVSGEYPGDGKPKPVKFPDPESLAVDRGGIRVLILPRLVELKLASGMTGSDRMKDLADVQELIKLLDLPQELGTELDESVREKYREIWDAVHRRKKRYLTLWRNKFLTIDANSLDEMIARLQDATRTLEAMRADGVTLDPDGGTGDDYAHLITTDPQVAKKYGMEDESEYWDDEDEFNEDEVGEKTDE